MSKRAPLMATSALVLGLTALAGTVSAKSLYGSFTEVRSGDTLVFRHDNGIATVRVFGVDAPEGAEPLALEAKLFMRALVMAPGKEVRIWTHGQDAEGNLEARILVDGQDIGLALVKAGLATRRPDYHYKPLVKGQPDELVAAEDAARIGGRGLWRQRIADRGTPSSDVPTASRGVVGTQDRNTSQKSGADNECAVIQNPVNPLQLYTSCNTSSAGLYAAFSSDGGATWGYPDPTDKTIADGDAGQGTSACCDPTLAWDRFGNLYVTYINGATNAIITLLSTDGGATYSQIGNFTGSVDQPTVVAASVGADAHVWVVWNNSGSMAAKGATATGLGTVSAFSATQTAPSTSGCNFGDIAISPTGAVIQVCEQPSGGQGPANLRTNIDADGLGAGTFAAVATATATNVGGFDFIPAQNGRSVDAEAGFAYDANPSSPSFGRLYLVYSEETVNENNDLETMVRYSDNDGGTWSAPIRVNDDATTRSQFLPKIATDPVTGDVAVCWHDARNSGTNTAMEVFCATAEPTAGTPVFSANIQVSDGASTSTGGGVEFGDYSGLTFRNGVITPVWADTSNSTGDNPNGTGNFDAYVDQIVTSVLLFEDGFEAGDVAAWDLCLGLGCPP